MNRMTIAASFVAVLCVAGSSLAQQPRVRPLNRDLERDLSERERNYPKVLAENLFREGGTVRPVSVPVGDPYLRHAEAVPSEVANGVEVAFDDVRVARYRFPSEEAAHRHLAAMMDRPKGPGEPFVASLDQDQVVVVTGEPVRRPEFWQAAVNAGWQGLPLRGRGAGHRASLVDLGDGSQAVKVYGHPDPLTDAMMQLYGQALRGAAKVDTSKSYDGQWYDSGVVRLEAPGGARMEMSKGDNSLGILRAPDAASEGRIKHHLAAMGGHAGKVGAPRSRPDLAPPAETPGAAGALNTVFR